MNCLGRACFGKAMDPPSLNAASPEEVCDEQASGSGLLRSGVKNIYNKIIKKKTVHSKPSKLSNVLPEQFSLGESNNETDGTSCHLEKKQHPGADNVKPTDIQLEEKSVLDQNSLDRKAVDDKLLKVLEKEQRMLEVLRAELAQTRKEILMSLKQSTVLKNQIRNEKRNLATFQLEEAKEVFQQMRETWPDIAQEMRDTKTIKGLKEIHGQIEDKKAMLKRFIVIINRKATQAGKRTKKHDTTKVDGRNPFKSVAPMQLKFGSLDTEEENIRKLELKIEPPLSPPVAATSHSPPLAPPLPNFTDTFTDTWDA